jgi:hypothetical protein
MFASMVRLLSLKLIFMNPPGLKASKAGQINFREGR